MTPLLNILLICQLLFAGWNIYRLIPEFIFSQGVGGKGLISISYFVVGTRLAPWEWQYRHFLANVLNQEGFRKQAIAEYRLVIKAAPYHFQAMNNMAVAYARMGNKEQAQRVFFTVLLGDPDNREAIRGLEILGR